MDTKPSFGLRWKNSNIAHQKEEIDRTQKNPPIRQKKFPYGLELLARIFGKLTTPSMMFESKKNSNIAHEKEEIDRTRKNPAIRQKKFPYGLEHFVRVFGKLTTPSVMFESKKLKFLLLIRRKT